MQSGPVGGYSTKLLSALVKSWYINRARMKSSGPRWDSGARRTDSEPVTSNSTQSENQSATLAEAAEPEPLKGMTPAGTPLMTFERERDSYAHWSVEFNAPVAKLAMNVDPSVGAIGDYELKLNSYDIGVDIELASIVRRIRFEHPEIQCVVLTGGIAGMFCAGANIRMLASAPHGHKINFCKFTNETRLEIEEASANSGLRFLAAINGACSGGGYELAMACDHLLLIDDRSTAVSLPEVPLLGVMPGTGGLTRVTDKRGVRRDRADIFATKTEGIAGAEALEWKLVDELAKPTAFDDAVAKRAEALAATSDRNINDPAVTLPPLNRKLDTDGVTYRYVSAQFNRSSRSVDVAIKASGDAGWPLLAALELDDVLCHLRFNEPELGTILLRTVGNVSDVLAHDAALLTPGTHAERETSLLWGRVLSRLDLMARSLFAVVEPGSCFAGVLAEIALAADRTYMLEGIFEDDKDPADAAVIALTELSRGQFPMANGLTRLQSRLWLDDAGLDKAHAAIGSSVEAVEAVALGLATIAVDDLDWHDEVRLAVEERATYSPDALTGMEANHRFCGPETMATKIFGRLSAWQNWIFYRPNASGESGSLRSYGSGSRGDFDLKRT